MLNNIATNDLVTFTDGLKVLIMDMYEYDNNDYLLVKQVNESETITIGDAFFLKAIDGEKGFECEYVKDDELIYSLMEKMRLKETNNDNAW